MNLKRRNGSRAIAALLIFFIAQIGLQVGLAEPTVTSTATPILPQTVGRLTTSNNQSIQVNGNSAATGASIVSGATLETGSNQSATVNLGALGSVEIFPNTRVVLTFDDQGNVKAVVVFGCVKVIANTNTTGEVATDQGSAGKTTAGELELSYKPGTAPVIGQGVCTKPAGGEIPSPDDGSFGLAHVISIVAAGTAAGITPLFFQDNPSGPSD